jgi:hypothetical protein
MSNNVGPQELRFQRMRERLAAFPERKLDVSACTSRSNRNRAQSTSGWEREATKAFVLDLLEKEKYRRQRATRLRNLAQVC